LRQVAVQLNIPREHERQQCNKKHGVQAGGYRVAREHNGALLTAQSALHLRTRTAFFKIFKIRVAAAARVKASAQELRTKI
jgi:hypothetical protein